jgi:hypothetical protein
MSWSFCETPQNIHLIVETEILARTSWSRDFLLIRFKWDKGIDFMKNGDDQDEPVPSSAVLLEITEPIIPCANLCKLSFINDELKTPQDRIQTCQHFLEALGQDQGLRGWYAKVLQEGEIRVGDTMQINKNSQR